MSPRPAALHLRLYIAGDSPNSQMAMQRLQAFCAQHCSVPPVIEVIDVLRAPAKALEDRVVLTPTLVRVQPAPTRRVVGNLAAEAALARALDLDG